MYIITLDVGSQIWKPFYHAWRYIFTYSTIYCNGNIKCYSANRQFKIMLSNFQTLTIKHFCKQPYHEQQRFFEPVKSPC